MIAVAVEEKMEGGCDAGHAGVDDVYVSECREREG